MSYSQFLKCGNAETFLNEAGQARGRCREEYRLVKAETHSSDKWTRAADNIGT